MNKIIVVVMISLVLCSFIIGAFNFNNEEGGNDMEEKIYQGPVRPTDDEEHFRKTGETKPLEINE